MPNNEIASKSAFTATHNIIFGIKRIPVKCQDNVFYTEAEWATCTNADWTWDSMEQAVRFQGKIVAARAERIKDLGLKQLKVGDEVVVHIDTISPRTATVDRVSKTHITVSGLKFEIDSGVHESKKHVGWVRTKTQQDRIQRADAAVRALNAHGITLTGAAWDDQDRALRLHDLLKREGFISTVEG